MYFNSIQLHPFQEKINQKFPKHFPIHSSKFYNDVKQKREHTSSSSTKIKGFSFKFFFQPCNHSLELTRHEFANRYLIHKLTRQPFN